VNIQNSNKQGKTTSLGNFSVKSEVIDLETAGAVKSDKKLNLVKIFGTIDLLTASEFQSYILKEIEKGEVYFGIDLSNLEFIDSMGISTIIMLFQKINEIGGRLILIKPRPSIMVVLKITRIHERINVFDDIEQAITSFKNY